MGASVHWTLLNIGTLGQNRLWGETTRRRPHICTMTALRSGNLTILVDPSRDPKDMPSYLDNACGIAPAQVDFVFLTHFHGDHRRGIEAFPSATWLMADDEIAYWWEHTRDDTPEGALLDRLERADDRLADGIELLPTPGHTPHHTGLRVEAEDSLRVIVAGDAILSRAHYLARQPYADKAHWDTALRTMDQVVADSDIVIPGHDNYFCTHLLPQNRAEAAHSLAGVKRG